MELLFPHFLKFSHCLSLVINLSYESYLYTLDSLYVLIIIWTTPLWD